MREVYYKTRVDTFLASVDVKPKESKEYGYTKADQDQKCQKLLGVNPERKQFKHH